MKTRTISSVFVLVLLLTGLDLSAAAKRPSTWATPLELVGVPNLHRVTPTLYRSAQPSREGMKNLQKLGIRTVVNLRAFHSDRDEIGDLGLGYEHIFMKTWHPEKEDVIRFLKIATDPGRAPVLVHCQHGADRTGTMVAIYRIVVQGWSREEALKEMTEGGFGFHEIWVNLPPWIQELNLEEIRRQTGLSSTATPE